MRASQNVRAFGGRRTGFRSRGSPAGARGCAHRRRPCPARTPVAEFSAAPASGRLSGTGRPRGASCLESRGATLVARSAALGAMRGRAASLAPRVTRQPLPHAWSHARTGFVGNTRRRVCRPLCCLMRLWWLPSWCRAMRGSARRRLRARRLRCAARPAGARAARPPCPARSSPCWWRTTPCTPGR